MTHDLARSLALVAADLDRRGYALTGVVRQAARQLLAAESPGDGCRGCGAELVYRGRGRPRVWCGETCRNRARARQ